MKPHPRIRRTIKWGGSVVTALLVVVWIASGWGCYALPLGGTRMLVLGHGAVTVFAPNGGRPHNFTWPSQSEAVERLGRALELAGGGPGPDPFDAGWTSSRFFLRFAFESRGGRCSYGGATWIGTAETIPVWCVIAVGTLAASSAWRLDTLARRLARLNLCPKCGYDRAGLAAGAACPECGRSAA
jgi:hypothetical protein